MINPVDIISSLSSYMKTVSTAIQAGKDAAPFAKEIFDILVNKKVITQEDLDRLAARSDAISDEIQKELPPEE